MKRLTIAFALLLTPASFAVTATSTSSCDAPSVPALDASLSNDVVWTDVVGMRNHTRHSRGSDKGPKAEVSITMKHLIRECWTGFKWDVELLLPDGVKKFGLTGISENAARMVETDKARSDIVVFQIVPFRVACEANSSPCADDWHIHEGTEFHEYRATLRVKFYPNAASSATHGRSIGEAGRVEHWRYPVRIVAH